jgi:hypothetical protein
MQIRASPKPNEAMVLDRERILPSIVRDKTDPISTDMTSTRSPGSFWDFVLHVLNSFRVRRLSKLHPIV